MGKIIGYGEDALTLEYLTSARGLRVLSASLQKKTKKSPAIDFGRGKTQIFYRPSFGRAQVGEPDFIIFAKSRNTQKGYWVIGESKWDHSGEIRGRGRIRTISIRQGQDVDRIQILRALLRFWLEHRNETLNQSMTKEISGILGLQTVLDSKKVLYVIVKDFFTRASKYFRNIDSVELLPVLIVFKPKTEKYRVQLDPRSKSEMLCINISYPKKDSYIELEVTNN